jgi:hypothetical protein
MSRHEIYNAILGAVGEGRLKEPFTSSEFKFACSGFAERTYYNFYQNTESAIQAKHLSYSSSLL